MRVINKNILFYFTNGRYTECLSLTNETNKSIKGGGNIQGKYKVLMLRGSHKKK